MKKTPQSDLLNAFGRPYIGHTYLWIIWSAFKKLGRKRPGFLKSLAFCFTKLQTSIIICHLNQVAIMNHLKQRLKIKMEEKGLSAFALERIAGLKTAAVYNILNDKSKNPKFDTLARIAKVLDCSVYDLTDSHINAASPTSDDAKPSPSFDLDAELFKAIATAVENYGKTKNAKFSLDQYVEIIKQAYAYAAMKNNSLADPKFIEWLVDTVCF